jgi:pyridoxamine 5'-phosphate oxidase
MTLSGDPSLPLPEFDAPPAAPIPLLHAWLASAQAHPVREPLALALATCDAAGMLSSRIVLAKGLDERGMLFTTHLSSRKGRDLAAVPRAAGTLYWRETLQQVSLAGAVERLSETEADALFAERPAAARATAIVSAQGQPLSADTDLAAAAQALLSGGDPLRRPDGWGGFRLVVDHVEFWHGSPDRLHRRLAYARQGDTWTWQRLQP